MIGKASEMRTPFDYELERFIEGYVAALLGFGLQDDDGNPIEKNREDIAAPSMASIEADCEEFYRVTLYSP